jgi:hypothetical protein
MTRQRKANDEYRGQAVEQPGGEGPESGGQSGDAQDLSQEVDAAEESVRELAAAGQDVEAQILKGVEDATDHPGKPVPDRGGRKR